MSGAREGVAIDSARSKFWRNATLVLFKTYADLKAEAARNYLGLAWWVADPILSMLVYYLVFSVGLKRGTDNFLWFLFIGLVAWRWFQTTVLQGAESIRSQSGLIQQVYVDKIVFPSITTLSNAFKFAVVFLLLTIIVPLAGFPIGAAYAALPLIVGVQLLVNCALAFMAAALVPFLPDLRLVLQNFLRLWFFLSGVFYDVDTFPDEVKRYLLYNPIALLLKAYRDVFLSNRWPDATRLVVVAAVAVVLLVAAWQLIRKLDRVYPKLKS